MNKDKQIEDLTSALMSMYEQYCAKSGHLFMSAGEEASSVLEQYGYGDFDVAGRLIKWIDVVSDIKPLNAQELIKQVKDIHNKDCAVNKSEYCDCAVRYTQIEQAIKQSNEDQRLTAYKADLINRIEELKETMNTITGGVEHNPAVTVALDQAIQLIKDKE